MCIHKCAYINKWEKIICEKWRKVFPLPKNVKCLALNYMISFDFFQFTSFAFFFLFSSKKFSHILDEIQKEWGRVIHASFFPHDWWVKFENVMMMIEIHMKFYFLLLIQHQHGWIFVCILWMGSLVWIIVYLCVLLLPFLFAYVLKLFYKMYHNFDACVCMCRQSAIRI